MVYMLQLGHSYGFVAWLPYSRLRNYPTGCGKGHDTAVLAAWLEDEMKPINLSDIEPHRYKNHFLGPLFNWLVYLAMPLSIAFCYVQNIYICCS